LLRYGKVSLSNYGLAEDDVAEFGKGRSSHRKMPLCFQICFWLQVSQT